MRILACVIALLCSFAGAQTTPSHPAELSPCKFGKDPMRDRIVVPPGRYLVTRPIVIDPEVAVLGGEQYFTRGWGPVIDLRGVVLVVSPEFVGDRVLDIVGTHPIIEGGTIDARWKAVANGAVFRAKVNPLTGRPEATGGRGSWRGGGIVGVFTKAGLVCSSAEEMTFEINMVQQGPGVGVWLENGGEYCPAWSQTMVLFDGCSLQAYGGDVIRVIGDVMDTAVRDSFLASPFAAVNTIGATGRRNRLDGVRFECGPQSTIVRGSAGWSRGSTVLSVSPIVSGWRAREPLPANTLPVELRTIQTKGI
ncbi:MAG: hypothetical protein KF812_09505 [Fimbriimonadaceae bacterium]|nr:hypothetical protein [Fimbriimonadaceae bacterium]